MKEWILVQANKDIIKILNDLDMLHYDLCIVPLPQNNLAELLETVSKIRRETENFLKKFDELLYEHADELLHEHAKDYENNC